MNEEHPVDVTPGWETGATRRVISLGVARAMAQALALAWFLVAARLLSDRDFGMVATGLAFFAILSGLGDLGMTRTVVRHVAADPCTLWPTYRRALMLRIVGGIGVGTTATAAVALAATRVNPLVVALAGVIATASGATELAYAGLRSVGWVRPEMVMLVVERAVFLAAAWPLLTAGAGPIAVLVLYALTNALSAVITGAFVRRAQPQEMRTSASLTDREARRTAAVLALAAVSPRASAVILAVAAGSEAVGVFSVAQRPVESVAMLAIATAAPVLPILRAHVTRHRTEAALHTARVALGTLAVALAPVVTWWMVAPQQVLDLLVGPERYPRAEVVLRGVALTALTWSLRGICEFLLLAQERAGRLLKITTTGLVVNVVLSAPLAAWKGATGAAAGLVVSEVVMSVMLLAAVPALVSRATSRLVGPAALMSALVAVTLVPVRHHLLGSLAFVLGWSVVALGVAVRLVRRPEVVT